MWPSAWSHVSGQSRLFQYRKRYEITCDAMVEDALAKGHIEVSIPQAVWDHMWPLDGYGYGANFEAFQYRKRYEITCDVTTSLVRSTYVRFQYRKRYEITCDCFVRDRSRLRFHVSIPQAVWDHMWRCDSILIITNIRSFNTASGMRSHVTTLGHSMPMTFSVFQYRKRYEITCDSLMDQWEEKILEVSIPQAVWDHMWRDFSGGMNHFAPLFQYRKRYEITCDLKSPTLKQIIYW